MLHERNFRSKLFVKLQLFQCIHSDFEEKFRKCFVESSESSGLHFTRGELGCTLR
jgi:hypothetical protein